MKYNERVDRIKDQVLHTISSVNDAFHLSAITLGNLIASVPEYFALISIGLNPALAATFALASVVTATLSSWVGGRMWVAFSAQIAISCGTVWIRGGREEAVWPLITAIVAISTSEYRKSLGEDEGAEKDAGRKHSLEEKKLDQKHEQAMERIRSKNGSSEPKSVNQIGESPDWATAENMRKNGVPLRKISDSLGISYGKVQRHFKRINDSPEPQNESVIHTNGVYP